MFPIDITLDEESLVAACDEGDFTETSHGHQDVLSGLAHGAEHSLMTGHTVRERTIRCSSVRSPG